MAEIWKVIPGFDGLFEVSNEARVRSGDFIYAQVKSDGIYFRAFFTFRGKCRGYPVHRLVLMAFVGPCPKGYQGSHIDGNPVNNRPENLCWETPLANMHRQIAHGTRHRGTKQWMAKVNDEQVIELRRLRKCGVTTRELSARYGLHRNSVLKIIRREKWGHLP